MAKHNFGALPRPDRRTETKTLIDPAQPLVEVTLTLQALDTCEVAVSVDEAEALLKRFGETGFPLQNGTAVPLSESICQSLAMVARMQCGPEEERYTAEELIGLLANLPAAGMELLDWAAKLNGDTAGNAARAAAG